MLRSVISGVMLGRSGWTGIMHSNDMCDTTVKPAQM
jgi:hypothetical protein